VDAAGWDRRYSTTELIWTVEPNRFLVAGLQPGRALDLGAGEGRNAVWLPSRGVGGPQDPGVLFGPGDVTADLADTGVELVRAEGVHRHMPADDALRTAIDALVRGRRPT